MTESGAALRCHGAIALAIALAALWGCNESRSRPTVPVFGDLAINSDPPGAQIAIDGVVLDEVTPTVLEGIEAGRRMLELSLNPGPDVFYSWQDSVTVPEEDLDTVDAALEGGCRQDCPYVLDRCRITCRLTGRGDNCAGVFFSSESALEWPASNNGTSYGAGGRLLLAGVFDSSAGDQAGDTIAVQVFDVAWTGRRPPVQESDGRRQMMELEYWGSARYVTESLQGLSVKETLVAVDSAGVEDVLFIDFEIENVSGDERYRRIYTWIPEGGYTYESLYVGFGFDADVGSPEDDLGTFDPSLNLSFMYDASFSDEALGDYADRPALAGLVTVQPPSGTERTLTLWRRSEDWDDGDRHGLAWRILAGRLNPGDPIQDHPSPEIGYQGTAPSDYRLTEAHGPLRLAPGERITLTVAIIMAEPVPGTFTPGVVVPPGDPTQSNRPILTVADSLRALAARVPEFWNRFRP